MGRDSDSQKREMMRRIESELSTFTKVLEQKYDVTEEEIVEILKSKVKGTKKEVNTGIIPNCILVDRRLSALEAIVKFMKEDHGLRYAKIASALNRNPGTIGITYRNARAKFPERFNIKKGIDIPVSILKDRKYSVLESIVRYLKSRGMTLHEIAVAINRDDRTVWTVNNRAEKKA